MELTFVARLPRHRWRPKEMATSCTMRAGIGTGRGDLQRRDEVLGAVLADLADGQLASREHHPVWPDRAA